MSYVDLARQFVDYYYDTFDIDRQQLVDVYRKEAQMTWQGERFDGGAASVDKLVSLPYKSVKHKIQTIDSQPVAGTADAVFIVVTGTVSLDNPDWPKPFHQSFFLVSTPGGTYKIGNDVLRIQDAETA